MQHLWMIAYDISDSKIRRKISKHLKNHGERVQYSIFECRLSKTQQQHLHQTLENLIDTFDKIRWYPLCTHCEHRIYWQGKGGSVETNEYYLL